MTVIGDIRAALADAIDGITGSDNTTKLRASAYLTDQVNPPQAMVVRKDITYDLTMGRGADEYAFSVQVFAGRVSERIGQEFLDDLCEPGGAYSLKTVLEADPTLNGVVDYARVRTAGPLQVVTVGTVDYLLTEFEIEVVV